MEEKIFSRKRFLLSKCKKKSVYTKCNDVRNNLGVKECFANKKIGNGKYIKYDNKFFQHNESGRKLIKIFIVIVIAVCLANRIIATIEPTMDVLCMNIAKGIATQISNEQATIVMANYKYDDLSTVIRDNDGKIQMIKMNVIVVNEIISDVAIRIQEAINDCEKSTFYIKLGTFSGTKILSGRGPKVEIKMSTTGNVLTDLVSEFSQAGVNQTLHRVYLKVDCSICVLTPFDTIEEKITNQVLLAEAVIVGEVPETYYNLNGVTNDDLMEVME